MWLQAREHHASRREVLLAHGIAELDQEIGQPFNMMLQLRHALLEFRDLCHHSSILISVRLNLRGYLVGGVKSFISEV